MLCMLFGGASIAGVRDLIEVSVVRRPTPPAPEAVLEEGVGGKNRVKGSG